MTNPNVKKRRAKPATPRYHWFQGASVRELYNQLGAAGPDAALLEVHQSGDKMTFRVGFTTWNEGERKTSQSRNPPINDSHVCPPQCP